ncbi:MAG: hypothetical protein MHM6MM_000001 [Cercozoa sp. M6MM]
MRIFEWSEIIVVRDIEPYSSNIFNLFRETVASTEDFKPRIIADYLYEAAHVDWSFIIDSIKRTPGVIIIFSGSYPRFHSISKEFLPLDTTPLTPRMLEVMRRHCPEFLGLPANHTFSNEEVLSQCELHREPWAMLLIDSIHTAAVALDRLGYVEQRCTALRNSGPEYHLRAVESMSLNETADCAELHAALDEEIRSRKAGVLQRKRRELLTR